MLQFCLWIFANNKISHGKTKHCIVADAKQQRIPYGVCAMCWNKCNDAQMSKFVRQNRRVHSMHIDVIERIHFDVDEDKWFECKFKRNA